jgi:hypothetical protein
MPVRLKVDFPDAAAVFKQLGLTGAVALTRAMGEIVDGWKAEIRAAVRQNFKSTPAKARKLGLNFEKSFQGTQFPEKKRRKVSFHPAGFLNAKADFAEIFETGGPVGPRHGKYLAIALPAARKLGLDYGYAESGPRPALLEALDGRGGREAAGAVPSDPRQGRQLDSRP